jgi:hypothetical protein
VLELAINKILVNQADFFTVQYERLLNDGILMRQQNAYHFTDPFFRRWVLEL